ncbi:MAG: CotH kinase family protein [Bacteroidia bacterium]|nr:CotH kinase family protein [Bacteroidia bacterium]
MKIKLLTHLLLLLILPLFLSGCVKENYDVTDTEKGVFNFVITESQRQYINASRGEQYEITNPIPELHFAGNIYTIDRFEIRGDNTLNFTRKGFGVNMDRKITLFNPDEQTERKYEEFKLLAMVYDYTYIENSTAVGLFREVNLWPVYSFFTEVRLNNHTQGLYHFIEDPVEYFIEQKNASFVLRRGYDHIVKAYSSGPDSKYDQQKYISRFKKIYSDITIYSDRQLYDTLSAYMDMEQYFTKLSIDMLIKNGDYTDEIFFYTKIRNNKEVFGVFPWDYDDIFADEPHEIGRSWATGTVFGHREYSGMDDIIADVGSKLLFSIEDDLDYKIAKDSVLYQQYLMTLRTVIEKINIATIDKIFDYTYEHIGPFYADDSIVTQSKFDVDETNYDLFVTNLAEKRQMLKDRRNWILQELDIQQNQLK